MVKTRFYESNQDLFGFDWVYRTACNDLFNSNIFHLMRLKHFLDIFLTKFGNNY